MGPEPDRRPRAAWLGVIVASALLLLAGGAAPAVAEYDATMPPGIDPGTPSYAGSSTPLPGEPVRFDPRRSPLRAIFDADAAVAAARTGSTGCSSGRSCSANDTALYTRGRALYMYTHDPATLGFAGGYAYRERPTGRQPGHVHGRALGRDAGGGRRRRASSTRATGRARSPASGLSVVQNEVHHPQQCRRHGAGAHEHRQRADDADGDRAARRSRPPGGGRHRADGLGDGALRPHRRHPAPERQTDSTASGTTLTRTVTLDPGAVDDPQGADGRDARPSSPGSAPGVRALSRLRPADGAAHPAARVQPLVGRQRPLHRHARRRTSRRCPTTGRCSTGSTSSTATSPATTTSSRSRSRACSATTTRSADPADAHAGPEVLQRTRSTPTATGCHQVRAPSARRSPTTRATPPTGTTPTSSTSRARPSRATRSTAATGRSSPTSRTTPSATSRASSPSTTRISNGLIEYARATLTGNDADAVALAVLRQRPQDRTETAFWYSGAKRGGRGYGLLGNTAKAAEMNAIAEKIKTSILDHLWDDAPGRRRRGGGATRPACPGRSATRCASAAAPSTSRCRRDRQRPARLHDRDWVNPAGEHDVVARLRLRHRDDREHVPDRERRGRPAAVRDHHRRRRRGAADQRARAAAREPVDAPRGDARGHDRHALRQRRRRSATNTGMTLTRRASARRTSNWIGRSQYGDPTLRATVDDFQIYDRALSDAEVRRSAARRPSRRRQRRRLRVRRGQRDDRDRLVGQRSATRTIATLHVQPPGQGVPAARRRARRPGLLEGPAELLAVHRRHRAEHRRVQAGAALLRRPAEFPIMPSYTANQADKAEPTRPARAGATTSPTSTRPSRRSSTPRRCATTRRSTSRRTCTAGCSSG